MPLKKITYAAVIGAAYAALTILLAPISYGPVQFRLSEALCILPYFFPFSVWGLFVGCILANLISAYGIMDIVFGSLATLVAALITMRLGRSRHSGNIAVKALACFPPVLTNGVIVGAVIAAASSSGASFWADFAVLGLQVALGEAAVLYVIGLPLMVYLPKARFFKNLTAGYTL